MALILEVLTTGRHPEVRARARVEGALTVGRALDNALVLDDPHVDAHHARIEADADGVFALLDLGSVNGLVPHGGTVVTRVPLAHGTVVTVGRTPLRVRDDALPVPAAIPLHGAGGRPGAVLRWHDRTAARVGLVAGALALMAADTWLETYERGAASTAFMSALFMAALGLVWAGVWAVAGRAVLGRFHFLAHATVAALALAALTAWFAAVDWITFLFPRLTLLGALSNPFLTVLLAGAVALHLSETSHLTRAQRWRVGAITGGIVLALLGVAALLEEDEFTPQAEFAGVVKPLTPALVPKDSPEDFARARADLRREVDALLADR